LIVFLHDDIPVLINHISFASFILIRISATSSALGSQLLLQRYHLAAQLHQLCHHLCGGVNLGGESASPIRLASLIPFSHHAIDDTDLIDATAYRSASPSSSPPLPQIRGC
jgi:hypothetical protein